MESIFPPINIQKWIQEHEQDLQPPVCNKMIFKEQGFIVMLIGGPNQRKDYHINLGPELFYQFKGDMVLKVIENNTFKDIVIKEGEMFLLPGNIPHSPQRFEDTVGLVVERRRLKTEQDGLQWYCDDCQKLLYEEYFELKDIEKDLPNIFENFFNEPKYYTCKSCGSEMKRAS